MANVKTSCTWFGLVTMLNKVKQLPMAWHV